MLVTRAGLSAFWLHVGVVNVWAAGRCPRGLLCRFRASSGLSGLSGRHFSLFARFRAEEAPCAAQRPGLECSAALGSGFIGLRCVDAQSNAARLGTSHFTEIWVPGPQPRICMAVGPPRHDLGHSGVSGAESQSCGVVCLYPAPVYPCSGSTSVH